MCEMFLPEKQAKIVRAIDNEKDIWRIVIKDKNYQLADDLAKNMWTKDKASKHKTEYNRGFLNTRADPHKTERIGRLAEVALGAIFNLPLQGYIACGDVSDFTTPNGKTIDVKATTYSRGQNKIDCKFTSLVAATDNYGKMIDLHSDIYVFALVVDMPERKMAFVEFAGWLPLNDVVNRQVIRSKRMGATHYNYMIGVGEMHRMDELEIDAKPPIAAQDVGEWIAAVRRRRGC